MSIWRRFFTPKVTDIQPGRQSVPEDETGLKGIIGRISGFYDIHSPRWPLEYLDVLEVLAIWNPDISQALSHIVNLGNTGHEIEVDAANPEAAADRLNNLAARVYRMAGGVDGLVNHLLRQIGLMGALSGEWVIAERLDDGVADVVTPPVRTIRFKRIDGELAPVQYTGRAVDNAYVVLNRLTYSYSPVQTMDDDPYGIPSFYAALKNIDVQLESVGGLAHIVRKMGLLGFMDVALQIPPKNAGESDTAYKARMTKRQQDYAAAYTANLSKGVAVHYADQEIKHNAIGTTAAAGAKAVFQINEEQIFSGLDFPPSMMGRSYSTTETYAAVDWDRIQNKLTNYRRIIKRFIEKGYRLDLLLTGIDADVSVHFNDGSGIKEDEAAAADGTRIDNVIKKRDAGFIDDDEAARELGYDEATGHVPGDNAPPWENNSRKSDPSKRRLRLRLDARTGRYEVVRPRVKITGADRMASSVRDRDAQSYSAALRTLLADAQEKAVAATMDGMSASDHADAGAFAEEALALFEDGLRAALGKVQSRVDRISDRYVSDAWQTWRNEETSFLQASRRRARLDSGFDLTQVDTNALRYLQGIDQHYFGKGNYLADNASVQGTFKNWLESEYIAKGLNIRDKKVAEKFFNDFGALVEETGWRKVDQLVDTTMARVQNMGQTLKLYEAGFQRFRIVGPKGGPICDYCREMVGRVFDVEKAAARLAGIVDKGFEDVADLPPFLSGSLSPDQLRDMTDEEIQAAGFDSPPFHPECRHRKAAED